MEINRSEKNKILFSMVCSLDHKYIEKEKNGNMKMVGSDQVMICHHLSRQRNLGKIKLMECGFVIY